MRKGKIIILNGGSSAGKTSLGKAMQDIMEGTWLLMGIDLFWFTLPQKQIDLNRVQPEYYTWTTESLGNKEFMRIQPGPILDDLMICRYKAIATFLDAGFNVIADDVVWKKLWLIECLKALEPYETYFVHAFCSDEESARRERQRGDRLIGWARGSAIYADMDALYDVQFDTTDSAPEVLAHKLKAIIENSTAPTAAAEMRQRFGLSSTATYGV